MACTASTLFILALSSAILANTSADTITYSKAVVESCRGCTLNRLPDIKNFIDKDVPNYDRVSFKDIAGAVPELVLYNDRGEDVERILLKSLTREECNALLVMKGFKRSSKPAKDEV